MLKRLRPMPALAPALGALLLLAIPAASRGADEVDKLVRRRLSPGSVALLARHTEDPRTSARLKSALADNSASVRTAAARLVALGGIAGLLSDLRDALSKETDADAAREEIRALCAVGGSAADAEALGAAGRFAPRLDAAIARLLARLRGVGILSTYFVSLQEWKLSPSDREAFFRLIVNRDGTDALAVAGSQALSHHAVKDWQALLAVADEREAPLDEGVLIAALGGEEPVFRGEAAWYMAKTYRKKPPANPGRILEAVSEGKAPASEAEERFGAEILRRVLGRPAVEDEDWIACLETNPRCHLDSDFTESPLVDLLTERERAALQRRNEAHRPPELRRGGPRTSQEEEVSGLRLISGLPTGMTADLLSAGGCRSGFHQRWYSVAEIEFGAHGLPRHVSLMADPPDPDCHRTAEAVFLMSAAPGDGSLRGGRGLYLALFDPDCLVCNEEGAATFGPAGESTEVWRVRARVVAPKLSKKVEPIYPVEARRQKQQGVNVYEAVISPTGCVREIRLVRGSYPLLDVTGMEAIARWRYTPASLNGRPVSVYLTVTVTYRLQA